MTFYTSIFKRSWEITRQNKTVWLFGLFVLFWGGKGMDFELFFTNGKLLGTAASPFRPEFWQALEWSTIVNIVPTHTLVLLFLALLVCSAFVLVIIMISQIGLVDAFGSRAQSRRKIQPNYTLSNALNTAKLYWCRVLCINLLGKVLTYALVALSALPLFFGSQLTLPTLYTFFFFLITTPIIIVISLVTKYAVHFAVLKDNTTGQAISKGVQLFLRNKGVSIEMAFLMFLGYFFVNAAALVVAALGTLPVLAVLVATQAFIVGPTLYYLLLYVVAFFLLVFSVMVFSAWHWGNWTLLFLELTKGNKTSKLHRVLNGTK